MKRNSQCATVFADSNDEVSCFNLKGIREVRQTVFPHLADSRFPLSLEWRFNIEEKTSVA